MATTIETLKKPNGDQVLPRTRAKAVSMEDGTTVEAAIKELEANFPKVETAEVGQTLVVKSVDENGKPTEWEAVDMPESTGGYTPVRGTDYWTDADKAEIKSYVDEAILGGAW